MAETIANFHWHCRHTWRQSAKNTSWCLLGCAIGDFGTIFAFQIWSPNTAPLIVLPLAILNGLLTSIALETFILSRQMQWKQALRTAAGMSLISMIGMELAMNLVDVAVTGGAILTLEVIPLMLLAGFLAPLPYNYWRLKALGKACH